VKVCPKMHEVHGWHTVSLTDVQATLAKVLFEHVVQLKQTVFASNEHGAKANCPSPQAWHDPQARSDVAVGATNWYDVPRVHSCTGWQTRSLVEVGA